MLQKVKDFRDLCKEFAMLHRREGEVYNCMKEKANFVKGALEEIESKEKMFEKRYQEYLETKHLKEADLRLIFLCNINNYVDNINTQTLSHNNSVQIMDWYITQQTLEKVFNHFASQSENAGIE